MFHKLFFIRIYFNILIFFIGIIQTLFAQIANPANAQKPDTAALTQIAKIDTPSYEVVVYGKCKGKLHEEDRLGDYSQPRWTASRRFLETRIYVIPKGQFEFEYWLIPEVEKNNSVEITQQYEMEMGLPWRFQLDLYVVSHQEGNEGPIQFDQQKFELRWALANWGKIPGNPTFYLEWEANNSAPSHVETKLLLGDQIVSKLHWGLNFVFEHETGGEQENSNEITGGLSYTVKDNIASVGAEVKAAFVDVQSNRGHYSKEITVGPSVQLHPLPRLTMDLVCLAGVTSDSPAVKSFLVMGWEF